MTYNEQPGSSHEPGQQPNEQKVDGTPAEDEARQPAAQEAQQPAVDEPQPDTRKRGDVRYQDPATTKPRPPTLGEQLARQRAEDEQRERELAQRQEAERKSRIRRRVMIGSGVAVGLVAVVAVGYAVASPPQVTAHCVGADNNVAVPDQNCDETYASQHGGYLSGGMFIFAGHSYRYYYGGSGQIGQTVTGGTFQAPPNAHISTPSGKTVQRGGFGIRSGSGGS
jgi:hypothetical protein